MKQKGRMYFNTDVLLLQIILLSHHSVLLYIFLISCTCHTCYLLLQRLLQRLVLHLLLPQTGGHRHVLWTRLCTHLSDLLIGPVRHVEWGKLTPSQTCKSASFGVLTELTYLSSFSSAWSLSVWYLCSSCLTLARYSCAHFFSTSSFCTGTKESVHTLYFSQHRDRDQRKHWKTTVCNPAVLNMSIIIIFLPFTMETSRSRASEQVSAQCL